MKSLTPTSRLHGLPRGGEPNLPRAAAVIPMALVAMLVVLLIAPAATAEVKLRWRGLLKADMRTYLSTDETPELDRLEGTAEIRLSATLSKHVAAVGHLRVMFTELGVPNTFNGLVDRTQIDPFRIESDALYVEFRDVGVSGLDIRIGRQQIIWGKADRFHAVSNLNPLDVEDPLAFGEVIANEMISIAYRPYIVVGDEDDPIFEELSFELVVVPLFKPAQIPMSGQLTFTDDEVFSHRADTPLLRQLVKQQRALKAGGWTFNNFATVETPEPSLDNVMVGARIGWKLFMFDMAVSYFKGFDDFPRAEKIIAEVSGTHADSDIKLTYPRVHVLGFELATSLDFLDGLGLWAEVGITFHDDLYRVVSTGPVIGVNEIEREHDEGSFVKAVVGMDYTPVKWLYLNVQYLYGFVDEFGTRNLQHYLVAGADFKMLNDRLLLRFFNIVSLTDGSFVLFPQLVAKPWDGGEISLGAFLYSSLFYGHRETKKFDSKAAGKASLFLKATAYF